jgi:O-antigen ligase
VIGSALVALAGLLVLAVDHSFAVQSAGPGVPGRLRGFGGNPNTDAMLFALVTPAAVWGVLAAPTNRLRVVAGGVAALLYGSLLASGSRGAMFASAAGVIVFVLFRVQRLWVRIGVAALLAAFFVAVFSLAGTRPSPDASTRQVGRAPTIGSMGGRFTIELAPTLAPGQTPIPFVSEYDEIGFPGLYQYKPILAYGSGRVYVWLSAIKQGLDRPLLGFGFGTEQYVFVDRSYLFKGLFTENSFVSIFLELGVAGVLLLLAPFAIVAGLTLRAVRSQRARDPGVIAVGAATIAAGLVIAFFQSYLHSVGNVATLTFWVILFLTVAVLAAPSARASEW